MRAAVRAIEYYLPKQALTNDDLATLFPDWPAERIEAKTGIVERRVAALTRSFRKAGEAALKAPKLRAQFRLADWEEQLVRDDPGFRAASPSSRLDAFVMLRRYALREAIEIQAAAR